MKDVLSQIKTVSSVNAVEKQDLNCLCDNLREVIKQTAYERGGHLASALGAVESITALCKVYDFERDKIIFDVGHQSYAYKILCRGKERFSTLRSFFLTSSRISLISSCSKRALVSNALGFSKSSM